MHSFRHLSILIYFDVLILRYINIYKQLSGIILSGEDFLWAKFFPSFVRAHKLVVEQLKQFSVYTVDLSPDYLDTHSFVHDNTEYILCGYGVTWHEARVICSSYKAELATVDTDRQARAVSRAIADSDLREYGSPEVHLRRKNLRDAD